MSSSDNYFLYCYIIQSIIVSVIAVSRHERFDIDLTQTIIIKKPMRTRLERKFFTYR